MANTYNVMQYVADRILAKFLTSLNLIATSSKVYQDEFRGRTWDTGATIEVPERNFSNVNRGRVISAIDGLNEKKISLSLDVQSNTSFEATMLDYNYLIDTKYAQRVLDPKGQALAYDAEGEIALRLFYETYNHIGDASANITSVKAAYRLKSAMDKLQIPPENRCWSVNSDDYGDIASLSNLQNSFITELARSITREAYIGQLSGFMTYSNIFMIRYVAGLGKATGAFANGYKEAGTIKTDVADGATKISITGLDISTVRAFAHGDKIKIVDGGTGVMYSLRPVDHKVSYLPVQMVVKNQYWDSDTNGDVLNMDISPELIFATTNERRNISRQIKAGDKVYIASAGDDLPISFSAGYIPEAIQFYSGELRLPRTPSNEAKFTSTDKDTGIQLRTYYFNDGLNDTEAVRMDMLYGATPLGNRIVSYLTKSDV